MAMQYTATLSLTLPQLVHCRHCDCQFVYEMTVSGSAFSESSLFVSEATAKATAAEAAQQRLGEKLDNPELCDTVPCPKCYCYQPYMYKKMAKAKYDYLGSIGLVLIALGIVVTAIVIFLGIISPKDWLAVACVAAGSVGAIVIGIITNFQKNRLIADYDPNKGKLAEREDKATEQAQSLKAFDEMQAKRVREEYSRHTRSPVIGPSRKRNPWDTESEPEAPNPWADDGPMSSERLIVVWWVVPSLFMEGGSIAIPLAKDQHVTVEVPEDSKPGDVLDLRLYPQGVTPFQVRLMAIRVHPEEMRLE